MCMPMTCTTCHKPGWSGCGAHVEQVLGHVPKDQRCRCREEATKTNEAGMGQPAAAGFQSRFNVR